MEQIIRIILTDEKDISRLEELKMVIGEKTNTKVFLRLLRYGKL